MSLDELKIVRYNPALKKVWDEYVESSKNGTFLFNRDYMDYHADRFHDHSLLFYKKDKLYCLFPANLKEETVYSHQGLTYGGLIMNEKTTTQGILEIWSLLTEYYKNIGVAKIIYKPVPHIYHKLPAEEDLYALFRSNARLIVRNVSSVIDNTHRIKFRNIRKSSVKKAEKKGVEVARAFDFSGFWEILSSNLNEKYHVNPVHSLNEITKLAACFPENIQLYEATINGETLAGVVCYVEKNIVHAQYISASSEGKETGALDAIFDYLINTEFKDKRYFDFGISNENGGQYLNESLIYQKEGFGGRAVCYDAYELDVL